MSNFKVAQKSSDIVTKKLDAFICLSTSKSMKSNDFMESLTPLSSAQKNHLLEFAKRTRFKWEAGALLCCDINPRQRVIVGCVKDPQSQFQYLEFARQALEPLQKVKSKNIFLNLRKVETVAESLADAFSSAMIAETYEAPTFKSSSPKHGAAPKMLIASAPETQEKIAAICTKASVITESTNFCRYLYSLPTNKLDCKKYVELTKEKAKEYSLKHEFIDTKKLTQLEAGAFLAVSRGSNHQDAGIVKLTYTPKNSAGHVALVGKGIVFDTGGVNVKPGTYMFGMHGDMGGSAVALSTILLAAKAEWNVKVTCYLAIAENAISNHAYMPNEVVTASNGKTIEIVHTDAEGRMVLADTLAIASEDKPDLMIDFATLTGSAVRAIGTTFSTGYSSDATQLDKIRVAGEQSGERVWPFPFSDEFREHIKSTVADIQQCKLNGGVDHIEAATFLSEFVGKGIRWVHIDLAACENEGGLAHISTKETGFGVRFAAKFIENNFSS